MQHSLTPGEISVLRQMHQGKMIGLPKGTPERAKLKLKQNGAIDKINSPWGNTYYVITDYGRQILAESEAQPTRAEFETLRNELAALRAKIEAWEGGK